MIRIQLPRRADLVRGVLKKKEKKEKKTKPTCRARHDIAVGVDSLFLGILIVVFEKKGDEKYVRTKRCVREKERKWDCS